jgi:lipoate-protein ligase A
MEADQVQLVRRVSGGGAVYHDGGNLNFSFIAGKKRYDESRQLNLVLEAVKSLGIHASFTGRNDLEWEGKKFSGNAFATRKEKKQHHGTLLVSADLERLSSYLTVDPKKIRSKGISSVRSRVCNLSEGGSHIDVKEVKKALLKSFERAYGYFGDWAFSAAEEEELSRYEAKHSSRAWRFGETPKFDLEWKERFPWGSLQLFISFEKGVISGVKAYSDAMDTTLCQSVEEILLGVEYSGEAIGKALSSSSHPLIRSVGECNIV